jgi:hypothetical protein
VAAGFAPLVHLGDQINAELNRTAEWARFGSGINYPKSQRIARTRAGEIARRGSPVAKCQIAVNQSERLTEIHESHILFNIKHLQIIYGCKTGFFLSETITVLVFCSPPAKKKCRIIRFHKSLFINEFGIRMDDEWTDDEKRGTRIAQIEVWSDRKDIFPHWGGNAVGRK